MRKEILLAIAGFLFTFFSSGQAYSHIYDWSDAPSPYGTAHSRGFIDGHGNHRTWQWLGDTWNDDSGPMHNDQDTSDDGIWWSTDGSTWGHPTFAPGQKIWLKFTANEIVSNWWKDYVRIWIDWNRDGVWSNTEKVWEYIWDDYKGKPATSITLTKMITVPSSASMGETWLRARIFCPPNKGGGPTGNNTQGEVEDWRMVVTPEPTSLYLLSIGLFGLGGFRLP